VLILVSFTSTAHPDRPRGRMSTIKQEPIKDSVPQTGFCTAFANGEHRQSLLRQLQYFSSLRLAPKLLLPECVTVPTATAGAGISKRGQMLKIERTSNGQVVFALSGRMDEEHIPELETLISSETKGRRIALDLKGLTLAGQDSISFLERCEADGITLTNCAGYVREWITRQRRGS
jgi:hypothetical protein